MKPTPLVWVPIGYGNQNLNPEKGAASPAANRNQSTNSRS
jgi:hypothetical protein